jgi:hypothetical protein
MSSARANASARNRRAGGNEMPPPQQMNGRPGQPQQQMQSPKLSISDAIALISLRLGRVEQIIQEIPMDRPSSSLDVDNEDVKIVDNEVFESILKRLDVLDKGYKDLLNKMSQHSMNNSTNITSEVNQAIELLKLDMIQFKEHYKPNLSVNQSANETVKTNEANESIEVLKAEMIQVKEHLLNLQSFTMQTNQKLVDVLLNNVVNEDDELFVSDINSEIQNENNNDVKDHLEQKMDSEELVETDTDNETNNVVLTETLLM